MPSKITENEIELFAIELLEKQGFEYIYAPNIAPDSDTPMRESFEDVILNLILFINGLPLVVVELKNPVDENATIKSAFNQIQTYKSAIPSLFIYNAFCIISGGLEAKAGTISAGLTRFMSWKSSDSKQEASKLISQVIVKRTLRQFGYPPDMQMLATETVLKQAEMIATELSV